MTDNIPEPSSVSPNSKKESLENISMRFSTLSNSSSVMVGVKRGYMISHTNTTTTTNNSNNKLMMQSPEASMYTNPPEDTNGDFTTSSSKKNKGRPLGSKNRPKPPIVIKENTDTLMEPILIEISAGKDVVETLINFAHCRQSSITVLSGIGPVSDVTLLNPLSRAPTFPMKGLFNMLSLSGTYVNANCGHHVPPRFITEPTCSSFSIYLSGDSGQVFGGIIGGVVKAVGDVLISAALFKKPEFQRLTIINGSVHEIEENNDLHVSDSDFSVAPANSTQLNSSFFPLPFSSTDVNVIQWNHSTH